MLHSILYVMLESHSSYVFSTHGNKINKENKSLFFNLLIQRPWPIKLIKHYCLIELIKDYCIGFVEGN